MRTMIVTVLLLAAAACAAPSERIATALGEAGLDARRAQCVGTRLEDDLSLPQLRQLAAAARAYRADDRTPGRLTLSDLARVAGAIDDPAVPFAVARAAAACA